MIERERVEKIIHLLRKHTVGMTDPAALTIVKKFGRNPFLVLISCMLSLRTQDKVSLPASLRLFEVAKTPKDMASIPLHNLEKLIYPVGFYKNKAKHIHLTCKKILTDFDGVVPNTREQLMSLSGVGRKTANLVLGEGFGIPAICVDTHVHRISNRLGIVSTKTVEGTEEALMKVLPEEYWIEYNKLLVMWGQNVCLPISPLCSSCILLPLCPQKGVTRHR